MMPSLRVNRKVPHAGTVLPRSLQLHCLQCRGSRAALLSPPSVARAPAEFEAAHHQSTGQVAMAA